MAKRVRKCSKKRQPPSQAAPPPSDVRMETALLETESTAPASVKPVVHGVVALVIMALCAGLYAWTADFPMEFDDHTYMTDNALFRDSTSFNYPTRFKDFVQIPLKTGADPDLAVNFVLRPVAYATLHLNYLFDDFRPRWFRAVNIVIHMGNALLIYALTGFLLRRSPLKAGLPPSSQLFIPATAALLFAVHPLATESVTYIIQRFTSLVVLFSLLSLWLYFASLHAKSRWQTRLLRGSATVVLLLAMQTKEDSFFVPPLAVLIDWLVLGTLLRTALWRALPLLLCMPLIPGLILLTSAALHGGLDLHAATNIVNSRDTPLHHWHYILTQFTVLVEYLRQLVWPTGNNIDPDWPQYESLWQAPVLGSLAILLTLPVFSWWLFRRMRGDGRTALGFVGVLWFFITISASSGLVPLPDMMAQHRTYMPFIGLMILVACLFDRLRGIHALRLITPAFVVLCLGAFSWKTCLRNSVWSTRVTLWEDAAKKSPGKYRVWGNLGAAYSDTGHEEKAVECYRTAIKIEPRFQNGLLNMSNSVLKLNRPQEALEYTSQLVHPDATSSRNYLAQYTHALALASSGKLAEAISIYRQLASINPNDARLHTALGVAYHFNNQPDLALQHYEQSTRLQPPNASLQDLISKARAAMQNR